MAMIKITNLCEMYDCEACSYDVSMGATPKEDLVTRYIHTVYGDGDHCGYGVRGDGGSKRVKASHLAIVSTDGEGMLIWSLIRCV